MVNENMSVKSYKYSQIAKEPDYIPKAYVVPYLPHIHNQTGTDSCVAQALSAVLEAQTPGHKRVSPLLIYGLWRKTKESGMQTETALNMGRSLGTAELSVSPVMTEVPEATEWAKKVLTEHPEAFVYKIGSWYKVDKDEAFNVDALLLKKALLQFKIPLYVLTKSGRHAEICIGWVDKGEKSPIDNSIAKEDAFIIQNSFGEKAPYPRHKMNIKRIKEAYLVLMEEIKTPFTDIEGHWAKKDIENAYFAGYLKGRTETEFEPEGVLKRGEAARILSEVLTRCDEKITALEERIKELEK